MIWRLDCSTSVGLGHVAAWLVFCPCPVTWPCPLGWAGRPLGWPPGKPCLSWQNPQDSSGMAMESVMCTMYIPSLSKPYQSGWGRGDIPLHPQNTCAFVRHFQQRSRISGCCFWRQWGNKHSRADLLCRQEIHFEVPRERAGQALSLAGSVPWLLFPFKLSPPCQVQG